VRVLGLGEQAVHDVLDVRPELLNDARRERSVDEASQARVIGRIAIEHRETSRRRWGPRARGDERGNRLLDETRIAQRRDDGVVARQDPEAEGVVVHRFFRAQEMVGRVGILDERWIHRVEFDVAYCASPWEVSDRDRRAA
jgi:hypothetical protein